MNTPVHQACLLLGSNISPAQNLVRGLTLLGKQVKIIRCSSVWETPSIGFAGPDFLNLAVAIRTPLESIELKEQVLRPLEARLGRVRSADKNAPRTIDLDIILFDDRLLDPNLWLYAHRAVPVAEILPEYRSEQGEYLRETASRLAHTTPIHRKDLISEGLLLSHNCQQEIVP